MTKKYNYIYKTTNNINGKIYIGVHSTNNLDDGYIGCGVRRQSDAISKSKKNPGKCRPSKRISADTPKTWGEMSKSEKSSAIADKNRANQENKQYGRKRFQRIKRRLK